MKALIIGGAGFVGVYLIRELAAAGYETHATCLPSEKIESGDCSVHTLDILEKDSVTELFRSISPDAVFHLAAQSSVAVSWKKPQLTADINVIGSINVLEAMRECGKSMRLILIGSGEEYGFIREGACPLSEEETLRPGNIYAATKACQGMLGEIYSRAYKLDIIMVRAFNHSGPGQLPMFVISDFCRQIAEIEMGDRTAEMSVGNLSAMRDFTDVRDVVRAYRMLAEKGVSGRTYNVGRGKAVAVKEILDTALEMSEKEITVTQDPSRMRASDIPIIEPDVTRIFADTGWKAEISMRQTIEDTLNYWRENL
ncbi:MAG: NAD-dependent epimerase/dehydratase family protein [Ruminococcus sp.]|nr:NAD-dependent epimerase/dehydratase family protein [Ruminococcus sp.]